MVEESGIFIRNSARVRTQGYSLSGVPRECGLSDTCSLSVLVITHGGGELI